MKKLLLAALLTLPALAHGAAVTNGVATAENATTPNTSGSFTPATDDLLIVGACVRNSVDATPTLTSSVGGKTFTLVAASPALFNTSANKIYIFVADQLASNASQTVTFDTPNDSGAATVIMVARVSGMTRTGTSAIKQTATPDENNASGQTPTSPFGANVDTNNPTIGFVCNNTNPATVTNPTNWTEAADVGSAAPLGGEYVYRDSGFSSTTITWGSTFGSAGGATSVELDTSSSAATFTAAPAQVAVTPVSVQISFTSDTTATVKGVFCADGSSTPSAAEVLAGQCQGGGAAIASYSEGVTATVADGNTISGLTPGTTYDTWHIIDATTDSAVTALANQTTSAVAYTSNPSCSATTNGASCTYTANATGTTYGVGVNPGDGTPTCSQIKAGNNDGGTAALWAGSDAGTLNVSDTVTVTGTNKPIRMNMHFCTNASGADSAVYSGQTNINRSPKAGFAIVCSASIGAGLFFDLDSQFNPDMAVGDCVEYEDDTNENANCNISIATDGDVVFTPVGGTDCDGVLTFEASYQDVSNATTGLFTAPTTGDFTTDNTVYANNHAPTCSINPDDDLVALKEDTAMTSVDLEQFGACEDEDGHALSYSISVGTLPVGTSLGGTGNKDWSGTPNTENEAGVALTVLVTDIGGLTTTFEFTAFVVNTWTVPNLAGLDASDSADAVVTAAPWRENDVGVNVGSLICDLGLPGLTVTQDPAAAAQAERFDPITINLSQLCASGGGRIPRRLGLGVH